MLTESKSQTTPPRIADTIPGKALFVLIPLFGFTLTTFAAGGEWFSLFPSACTLIIALLLFTFCLIRGYKLPGLGLIGWLTLGIGGSYFLIRAQLSPWFYEKVSDQILIVTTLCFFTAGFYSGADKAKKTRIPLVIALVGSLNLFMLFVQHFSGSDSSWFRPTYSFFGTWTRNIGLFGYKNFSAHFLSVTGFFLCSYSLSGRKKWGSFFFIGLMLIITSFFCHSRSAYPNAFIGTIICFFIYTTSVFRNSKKFYTAAFLFFLILFLGSSYVFLDLTNGAGRLSKILEVFTFGDRLGLFKLAWTFADQAPLFGHGSRMFTALGVEYFMGSNLPNFAHHEYSQMACDYGYTGLIILLISLIVFLAMGFCTVLRLAGQAKENDNQSDFHPTGPAGFCVLCIAVAHAIGDFIWHNPALLSMSAVSCGLIASSYLSKVKVAKLSERIILLILTMITIVGTVWYAQQSYSVWKLSFCTTKGSYVLPILDQASVISSDPELVQSEVSMSIQTNPNEKTLVHLNELLDSAERLSPGNHALVSFRGLVLMYQRRYDEAEKLLRPYNTNENRFSDNMYGWRTVYTQNLYAWSVSLAKENPRQALELALKTEEILKDQAPKWRYYGSGIAENRNKMRQRLNEVKTLITILRQTLASQHEKDTDPLLAPQTQGD